MPELQYTIDNVWCRVEGGSPSRLSALDTLLSKPMDSLRFSPKLRRLVQQGRMDGRVRLYDGLRKRFPAGLVGLVMAEIGGEIASDLRPPGPIFDKLHRRICHGIELTDWQLEGANVAIRKERGFVKMATNAGKTGFAAAILAATKAKALYLLHQVSLMEQTSTALSKFLGEPVGRLGGGFKEPDGRVVVAMVQSLRWRKKITQDWLKSFEVLMLDECHHGGSSTWYSIAQRCVNARIRIGMSGTPLTEDKMMDLRLMGVTSPEQLYRVRNKQLIDAGWSARPIVHLRSYHGKENGFDWDDAYKELLHDSAYNRLVLDTIVKEAAKGQRILVLTNRIPHGCLLRDMCLGKDLDVVFLSGADPGSWRKAKLDQLKTNRLQVVIATTIFDEGVDAPAINSLILASAARSPRQTLQRIGRALRRKTEGENVAHIYDFVPYTNYYLLKHAVERQEIYRDEEFQVDRDE